MAGFVGIKCIACEKRFEEKDDIVVCPDCGTPYHRTCYQEAGSCINTELHATGGSFHVLPEPNPVPSGDYTENAKCTRCGAENPPLSLFCERCGMPLSMNEQKKVEEQGKSEQQTQFPFGGMGGMGGLSINYSDPLCGFNPEEDFDGVKLSELADFVGTNTHYYLPAFKRMKETGRKLTWNFFAMLMPAVYYSYRKMNWWILLAFVLQFAIALPSTLLILSDFGVANFSTVFDLKSGSFQFFYSLCSVLNYGFLFAAGGFSNWLYYRHAISSIKRLREKELATPEHIKAAGGGSKLYVALFFLVTLVLGIVSMLAFGAGV